MYFPLLIPLITFISIFLTFSYATTPVVDDNVSQDEHNAIRKMAETVAQLQKELNDLSSSCDKKLDLITTGLRKDILSSQQSLEKCYEQKTTLNNNFTLAQKQLKEMEVFKSSLTQCQQKATLAKQTNQDTQSKMEKQLTDLQNENQQMKQKHRKEFSLHQSHLEKCYSDNQKTKKEIELANQQLTLNSQLLNVCKPYIGVREQFYILFNQYQNVSQVLSTKFIQWKNISLTYIIPKMSSALSPLINQWTVTLRAVQDVVVNFMEKNHTKKYLNYIEQSRRFSNTTIESIQKHYQTVLNSKTFLKIQNETLEVSAHLFQKTQQLTLSTYKKVYQYFDTQFPFVHAMLINASWNNFYFLLFVFMVFSTIISWTLFTLKLFFHFISFLFACLIRCFLIKCRGSMGKKHKKNKKNSVKQKDSYDTTAPDSQKNKILSEMSIFNSPQQKSKKIASQRSFKR